MIRQAISCDICASEKKQTNHWFVAYEQGGELRVGGWNSRNRLRPGSKHLCGQTCLHKLVDEFIAKTIASRTQPQIAGMAEPGPAATAVTHVPVMASAVAKTDTSLTSDAAYVEVESSARLIPTPEPAVSVPPALAAFKPQSELLSMPLKPRTEEATLPDEEPRFASRSWRAEAWERERERELRAIERRPDLARRRSSA